MAANGDAVVHDKDKPRHDSIPASPDGATAVDKERKAVETNVAPPSDIPPEEGLQGWLCVLGAFLCLFCSFGFLNAIGVFQAVYEESTLKSYSSSDISWIFALQLSLMWLPGPVFGRIVDTYGPIPLLWPSAALCIFGLGMTSLSTRYYQIILAQGLVFGIGAGGVFTTAFVCVGQWFVRRRGLATGIASSGSSVGGVIFPVMLNRLTNQLGLAGAVRYTMLLIAVCLVVACALVRPRLPRKPWNPNFKWFHPYLFKQKLFLLYCIGAFLAWWGLWGPFDFISLMAQNAGFGPSLAFYLISIINAASVPGRIIPAYLGDKYGHFNVLTLCSAATGISILALWLPFNYHPSHAGIIVFSIVFGFVSGAVVSLVMPCVAKTGTLDTIGQRFGTFQTVIGVASLTGLPISGAILGRQNNDDFSGLEIFCGASAVLGSSILAISTRTLAKTRNAWNV
ncbi:hypothetical protein SLS53_008174 [Cytospora paraplurivora]|uniref:Major facilitator superfamily (MFS) profile domain-containing protein n=1 Tax=Cytospora paraplurivora TaxID=2898453 RepID=A0AAN9YD41_9PEZI